MTAGKKKGDLTEDYVDLAGSIKSKRRLEKRINKCLVKRRKLKFIVGEIRNRDSENGSRRCSFLGKFGRFQRFVTRCLKRLRRRPRFSQPSVENFLTHSLSVFFSRFMRVHQEEREREWWPRAMIDHILIGCSGGTLANNRPNRCA